jgi:hypothetical protein
VLEVMQPDGSVTECAPNFAACQKAVGGYVEAIRIADGMLLVNEDGGLLEHLEHNPGASLLAGRTIVGPAVVLPTSKVKEVLG